jgi:phosphopantothenoylcysteine decarboxylase/phosphopantothenate--cysteine ligase
MCLARPMATVPLLLAPAMNREMWAHPATQRNVAQLRPMARGAGRGAGRPGLRRDRRRPHAGAAEILVQDLIAFFTPKLLAGRQVLVTAGPTYEAIDPVRGITNLSSGKMGFAIARAAREAGAGSRWWPGRWRLPTPRGVTRIDVRSARDMLAATVAAGAAADVFIATAAVADWRVANRGRAEDQEGRLGQTPCSCSSSKTRTSWPRWRSRPRAQPRRRAG